MCLDFLKITIMDLVKGMARLRQFLESEASPDMSEKLLIVWRSNDYKDLERWRDWLQKKLLP